MMNEKIKELANQAGITFNTPIDEMYGDFDLEKFAELIIKECTKVCNHTGLDVSNGNHIPAGFYDEAEEDMGEVAWLCAKRIDKHFGMK
jgi:hypothetical protein